MYQLVFSMSTTVFFDTRLWEWSPKFWSSPMNESKVLFTELKRTLKKNFNKNSKPTLDNLMFSFLPFLPIFLFNWAYLQTY